MRKLIAILSACLLTACVGNPPRTSEIAIHDLGPLPEGTLAAGLPLGAIDVRAASWLDTPAQLYRLTYAESARRHAYTASRWTAAPAELLERTLQRRIAFDPPGRCRLNIALDELEQRFATAQNSEVVLEARAAILPGRGAAPLAQRAFHIARPASTPDARGGVAATRAATDALAVDLTQWLGDLARQQPALAQLCKEAK